MFYDHDNKLGGDRVFLIEPGIDVGFTISDSFKITTGVSYKIITGVELRDLEDTNLNGVAVNLSFKIIRKDQGLLTLAGF